MGKQYGYMQVHSYRNKINEERRGAETKALKDAGAAELIVEYSSGKKMNYSERSKLIDMLTAGDTLVVTALDKLGTTATEAFELVSELMERGVTVEILNMRWADGSDKGMILTTVLRAFAAFEHAKLVECTQTGKGLARVQGVKVDGRRPPPKEKVDQAMRLKEKGEKNKVVAAKVGVSPRTVARWWKKWKAMAYLSENRPADDPVDEIQQGVLKDDEVAAGIHLEEPTENVCVASAAKVKPPITLPPAALFDDVEDVLIAFYGETRVEAAFEEEDLQDDDIIQDTYENEPTRCAHTAPAAVVKLPVTHPPENSYVEIDDDPEAFAGVIFVDVISEEESYRDDTPAKKEFREGKDDLFPDF